ncbi:MAG: SDR family NAD(P)-dependent oxidoreductase [Spirochaetaceae bacterium]|jgi:NAD(P)-dependent dehydrogenase (short-subunit alcohol dehydrogenase family)|nr:SDR family NAD(P)-dependent oxidoreductase [Spirochaetaceae bacterium]
MEKLFDGRTALVVGGTGGIGRFISRALARRGAALTVIGSSPKRLQRTCDELSAQGAGARGFALNLDADTAVRETLAVCAQTDILVCAFGPFLRRPLAETTPEDWRRLVTLNLILPGSLVSAYLAGMMERRWGRILLFGGSNTESIRGWTTTAPYAAAKTALGPLAKSVAKNAAAFGVTCNLLCPGLTDTEYLDEAARRYNREHSPTGRPLTPEEVAAFALEILANPNLNGAILPLDNGLDLHIV